MKYSNSITLALALSAVLVFAYSYAFGYYHRHVGYRSAVEVGGMVFVCEDNPANRLARICFWPAFYWISETVILEPPRRP